MDLAIKTELGFRAYLNLQGHGDPSKTYISLNSGARTARSRTFIVHSQSLRNPFRPQGDFMMQIQHVWDAVTQPADACELDNMFALSKMLDDTTKCFFAESDGQSPLPQVADAITAAGRALAIDASNGGDPAQAALAAKYADMANFRVDWIKGAQPFRTRGETETHHGIFWCEILNFHGYSSYANV